MRYLGGQSKQTEDMNSFYNCCVCGLRFMCHVWATFVFIWAWWILNKAFVVGSVNM